VKRRGSRVGHLRKPTPKRLSRAQKLIEDGGRGAAVAALFGINVSTLRLALNALGAAEVRCECTLWV
jgi:DNA invertase Pin-like site-specific DNA recombinase